MSSSCSERLIVDLAHANIETNDWRSHMLIKSYKDVSPTSYQAVPEGVQIREMITARDGAPTFAMRVLMFSRVRHAIPHARLGT